MKSIGYIAVVLAGLAVTGFSSFQYGYHLLGDQIYGSMVGNMVKIADVQEGKK